MVIQMEKNEFINKNFTERTESSEGIRNNYLELLEQTKQYAAEYIRNVDNMPVYPNSVSIQKLDIFNESMPLHSSDPFDVMKILHKIGSAATTGHTGGRYFGFVNGGILPISHAAAWLTDTWNQNSALYVMSPISSKLEEICEQWIVELFGLEKCTAAGLVSGSSNATICALAAARNHILYKQGYDIAQKGLHNAPPIRVIVNEQAHSSVWKALALLGIGKEEIMKAPTDSFGRINLSTLPALNSNTLLIIQAGNVNGGAYDPIHDICDLAQKAGAWVHIDGAFGLWAAASKKQHHLVEGLEKADSYSVDAHKTLNASYDCGIVLCKHREALIKAMQATGAYIHYSENRDGMLYTTEMSRRARSVILWATLKQLGANGVEQLVDTLCERAEYFADQLNRNGFIIVQPVFFNQFMVKCETSERTKQVLERVQNSGICWCGGSTWQGEAVIRISISSHRTTKDDIDKSVTAFVKANT